jgi:hypothetical protein
MMAAMSNLDWSRIRGLRFEGFLVLAFLVALAASEASAAYYFVAPWVDAITKALSVLPGSLR